jgi:ribosomal protein S18 acetylase RimI-like enzyme
LEPGFRDRASLDSLFDLLERLPAEPGPVIASTDFYPGVPLDRQASVLVPRGFVHVDQQRMVFRANHALPQEGPSTAGLWRHPTPEDIDSLIDLFVRAYRTDPTQLEWPQVRLKEDATHFVRGLFERARDFDPLSAEWSFVTEQEGVLMGAILVVDVPTEGPFISDLMVDPSVRRRGIGRRLMVRALSAARAARPDADIRLTVETQNRPAYELYTTLGFVPMAPEPGQRSGVWLRRVAAEKVTGTQSGWDLSPSSGTAMVSDPRGYVRAPTSSFR